MKTLNISDEVRELEKQIAILQSRKEAVAKLLSRYEELNQKASRILGSQGEVKANATERKRHFVLPRGVITMAAFEALKRAERPLSLGQILQEIKTSPLLANAPEDLDRRLRGVLQTSDQFRNVGGNTFTIRTKKLEGALFERLAKSLQEAR